MSFMNENQALCLVNGGLKKYKTFTVHYYRSKRTSRVEIDPKRHSGAVNILFISIHKIHWNI